MYFAERFIICSIWVICLISIRFIPKQMYRQATFIFIFTQLPAWLFGLLVVEAGWIEYPVRELHKANGTSFTFEFFVLPIMCIFFNIYYPNRSSLQKKALYFISIIGTFTLIEFFVEKYTMIIQYIHWQWYITFITMSILMYLVRFVYKWFFNL